MKDAPGSFLDPSGDYYWIYTLDKQMVSLEKDDYLVWLYEDQVDGPPDLVLKPLLLPVLFDDWNEVCKKNIRSLLAWHLGVQAVDSWLDSTDTGYPATARQAIEDGNAEYVLHHLEEDFNDHCPLC